MQLKTPDCGTNRQFLDKTFELCIPEIKGICHAAGHAGVSVGVLHKGEQRTFHYGFRDVEKKLPPDDDTLYCIASLTKAMTATALADLVEEQRLVTTEDGPEPFPLSWKTKISDIFPHINSAAAPHVAEEATVRDFLSHHTGLSGLDNFWQGLRNHVTIDKEKAMEAFNSLPRADCFRDSFIYNNLQYSIAGNIIEKVSGKSVWGDYMKERVFRPLGMNRTTPSLGDLDGDDNVAEPYVILVDGTPYKIGQPQLYDTTLVGSAGGVRSSVRDMLKWGGAFLHAQRPDASHPSKTSRAVSSEILSAVSIVKPDPEDEHLYGMGWYHQRLPSKLGPWSENLIIAPQTVHIMPTGSKACDNETYHVFSHGGLTGGFTTSFYVLPNPGTVIIVLSNSNALGDAADRIAHALLQRLLQIRSRIDFVSEAKKTADYRRRWFQTCFRTPWVRERGSNAQVPLALDEYVGEYELTTFPFTFCITETGKSDEDGNPLLTVTFNRKDSQVHQLEYYDSNRWSFLPQDYDMYIKTGYLAWENWKDFLIDFRVNEDNEIVEAVLTSEARPLSFKKKIPKECKACGTPYSASRDYQTQSLEELDPDLLDLKHKKIVPELWHKSLFKSSLDRMRR